MGRTRVFLAMPTMAQVEAIEFTFDLKTHRATQTRTDMITHWKFPHRQRWLYRFILTGMVELTLFSVKRFVKRPMPTKTVFV